MKVGFAIGDITPEIGIYLTGYGHADRIATGVHSPLCASVMVFGDEAQTAAVVSLDWCTLEEEISWDIRNAIEKVTGIKAADIIVCCVHTHSAPLTGRNKSLVRSDCDLEQKGLKYAYAVIPKIAETVKQAKDNMRECSAGFGATKTKTGVSRRGTDRNGNVSDFIEDPYLMHDDNMTVVRFKNAEDGNDLGIFVHCSAHNTSMGINREFSSDWCGIMRKRIQDRYDVPVVFVNGAVGDSGPRTNAWVDLTAQGFAAGKGDGISSATEVGLRAATDALRVLETMKYFTSDLPLTVEHNDLRIPQVIPMTVPEAEKRVKEYEAEFPVLPEQPDAFYLVAKLALETWKLPPEPELVTKQTLIAFGPLVFIPFPFEMFSAFSLRLRKYSSFEYPLLCSIANGYYGYMPDKAAFPMGGYEVAWLPFARSHVITPNAGDVVITQTLDAIDKLAH